MVTVVSGHTLDVFCKGVVGDCVKEKLPEFVLFVYAVDEAAVGVLVKCGWGCESEGRRGCPELSS